MALEDKKDEPAKQPKKPRRGGASGDHEKVAKSVIQSLVPAQRTFARVTDISKKNPDLAQGVSSFVSKFDELSDCLLHTFDAADQLKRVKGDVAG